MIAPLVHNSQWVLSVFIVEHNLVGISAIIFFTVKSDFILETAQDMLQMSQLLPVMYMTVAITLVYDLYNAATTSGYVMYLPSFVCLFVT